MTTALQKQLDALFSDFTSRLTQLVREASLFDLVAERAPEQPAARVAPKPKVEPKAKLGRRPAAPKAPRRRTPELPLDEVLLRHLRSGVLLTIDELLGFAPDSRKVRAAIDDLAARGLIGFSGEEPDRFVFAKSGRPEPSRAPAREPRPEPAAPTPAPVEAAATAEPEPESAPISTVTGEPPASAPDSRQHPFVVRRKKVAT